jgi:hypothetical protein
MPEPLPILVIDETAEDGTVSRVDRRDLRVWRELVIAHIKAWAGEILSATDWLPIRALETGVPIDPALTASRQLVRDTTNSAEQQLNAATSLDEIDAVTWSQSLAALDTTQTPFSLPEQP